MPCGRIEDGRETTASVTGLQDHLEKTDLAEATSESILASSAPAPPMPISEADLRSLDWFQSVFASPFLLPLPAVTRAAMLGLHRRDTVEFCAPVEPAERSLTLVVLARSHRESHGQLFFVGRSSTSDCVLPSPSVSRSHACFHRKPGDLWYLVDMGSTNGTCLRGKLLEPRVPCLVRDWDLVEFPSYPAVRFLTSQTSYELLRKAAKQQGLVIQVHAGAW
jgi:hypothetical protein